MAAYFMFGKYSSEAIKGISPERTKKALGLISGLGGKVISMYVLLGNYDLVLITDFPSVKEAVQASIKLAKETGISFTSSPALTVEEFDKIAG